MLFHKHSWTGCRQLLCLSGRISPCEACGCHHFLNEFFFHAWLFCKPPGVKDLWGWHSAVLPHWELRDISTSAAKWESTRRPSGGHFSEAWATKAFVEARPKSPGDWPPLRAEPNLSAPGKGCALTFQQGVWRRCRGDAAPFGDSLPRT